MSFAYRSDVLSDHRLKVSPLADPSAVISYIERQPISNPQPHREDTSPTQHQVSPEIVDNVVHQPTNTTCWCVHRPTNHHPAAGVVCPSSLAHACRATTSAQFAIGCNGMGENTAGGQPSTSSASSISRSTAAFISTNSICDFHTTTSPSTS
ncbi:hypothetical protein BKA70DRAFT_531786 [Coprinopsis sp. MPI-PUGE-AT-0042]|nr:hypothetical protein BKA70DRAFT_531786 [Coprinopsis sp. MPI-PUGE-AT-0042]